MSADHCPRLERLARIGLFGGAFDPPHNAHLALARAAVAELGLQRLHIVPTGHAWHKARALSDGAHRLAMCALAFADVPQAQIDPRELHRSGPSYTIDTLRQLRAEQPQAALYLIIGTDQAHAFHTWQQAAEIVQTATVAIAVRGGATPDFDPRQPLPGVPASAGRVRVLHLPPAAHSATEVRQRAAAGQSLAGYVPAAVARYIARHSLYQPTAAA